MLLNHHGHPVFEIDLKSPNPLGERWKHQRRHCRSSLDLQEFGWVANQSPAAAAAAKASTETLSFSAALDEFGPEE